MRFLILLLLASTVQAATPDVQSASWDFAGFDLEIANQWYFFPTRNWTLKETLGVNQYYESDVVTITAYGQTVTAQLFGDLYRPYCGRSRCVVYKVISETVSIP